ncbi:MAG: caspase family protein [Candidatus Thorarchaeota archaeon]|nr:caspase family protein [Candidatus Thorarchaeota archaeon]
MKRTTILGICLLFVFGVAFLAGPIADVTAISTDSTRDVARGQGGRWRNTAPVVTISEPSNLARISGTVLIVATATDGQDGSLIPSISIDGVTVAAASYNWDTTVETEGSHVISASATDSGGLTGSASVTVTVDNVEDPPPPPGQNKYALIVGISDYSAINDLTYCDEDATDWYNYLSAQGYVITLLGDGKNYYPQWDGYATESNVKAALANMIALADADDIIVYASSGHGTTYSGGETICLWDYGVGQNGEDGSFTDVELAAAFEPAVSEVFIFLDHCYSGGMNEVMANANGANIYLTTTCTDSGYGYDVSTYSNGAWTYWFLEAGLVGQGFTSMELCFDWALSNYPYDRDDTPQEFDGNPLEDFLL